MHNQEQLAKDLAKSRQYIIVKDGFDLDGTNKFVIRKVQSASAIIIGKEILWCVNILEPVETHCTGISIQNVISYSSYGRIYPSNNSGCTIKGVHSPKCNEKLNSIRKRLAQISRIHSIDLEECQQKIFSYMKIENLTSHETLISSSERQITISSYKSEENLVKALKISSRFNKYNMCIKAQAIDEKFSVKIFFQF